jgi:ATP/maltotriose-dependent transcriptional regulator MalT
VHWREGLAISERDGLVQTRGYLLTNLAEAALRDGNLDMAWRDAERGLEVAQATGNVGVRAWLQYLRARVALRRGDTPAAREALAQGVEVAVTHGMASLKAYGLLVFAELLEAQGRAMAARRLLAFAADNAAFNVADRDELRSEWARRAGAAQPDPAWCGPALDELLHRIVSERTRSHDGLIAELG